MSRPEQISIQKHMSREVLLKRIKTLETNIKVLQRLYFIKYRYDGESVENASHLVGVAKQVGYAWQKRWNDSGYDGLIPRYAGGRPSKLSQLQKGQLKLLLEEKDSWTTDEVRLLILNEFGVEYTLKQVRIIVKKFGMRYAKPFTLDYRKPPNSDQILKKIPQIDENTIVGFFDESSPQTTANTRRLLSFGKPVIYKNTTKYKANAFGFYALNGVSVIDFKNSSKKEDVCEFFKEIRFQNPENEIVLVLDNFQSHRAKASLKCAEDCNIKLVFLPPYSPDLNPIEFIWKSIKRIISRSFIKDLAYMKQIIHKNFIEFASRLSFAKSWIEKFLDGNISSNS